MRTIITFVLIFSACSSDSEGLATAPDAEAPGVGRQASGGEQDVTVVKAQPVASQDAQAPDSWVGVDTMVAVSPDTLPSAPDTYVAPSEPVAQWFGPPPARIETCPPVKPTPLGIGSPCTDGGGECKNGLKCGCTLHLDIQGTVLRNIPCFCVTSNVAGINSPATCDNCGEGAACCKALDRKMDNAQFLCLPLSCSSLCTL